MSSLLGISDDWILCVFALLDICSIGNLDIAVTNSQERERLLKSFHAMDIMVINKYEHGHSSLRLLMKRGIPVSRIKIRETKSHEIKKETFTGYNTTVPTISSIDIQNCSSIEDATILDLIDRCPQIQDINLLGTGVSDHVCAYLAINFPLLTRINLSLCRNITDKSIESLAIGCPQLTVVFMSWSFSLTDRSVLSLNCPQLAVICIDNNKMTDASVLALARGCPQLRVADFSNSSITDSSLLALVQGCPQLTFVSLENCKKITKSSVFTLASGCPNLNEVFLGNFRDVSDTSIKALAIGCPLISRIDLNKCLNITDASVLSLVQYCPNLSVITLLRCRYITDSSLVAVGRGCPSLRAIGVSNCMITDIGVLAIADGCRELDGVGFDSCHAITCHSISILLRNCTNLRRLCLDNSKKFSIHDKEIIKASYPLLELH